MKTVTDFILSEALITKLPTVVTGEIGIKRNIAPRLYNEDIRPAEGRIKGVS
jgi:hypothetical protein